MEDIIQAVRKELSTWTNSLEADSEADLSFDGFVSHPADVAELAIRRHQDQADTEGTSPQQELLREQQELMQEIHDNPEIEVTQQDEPSDSHGPALSIDRRIQEQAVSSEDDSPELGEDRTTQQVGAGEREVESDNEDNNTEQVETDDDEPEEDRPFQNVDIKGVGDSKLDLLIDANYNEDNIQDATVDELTRISGIGESTAEKIVQEFQTEDDNNETTSSEEESSTTPTDEESSSEPVEVDEDLGDDIEISPGSEGEGSEPTSSASEEHSEDVDNNESQEGLSDERLQELLSDSELSEEEAIENSSFV